METAFQLRRSTTSHEDFQKPIERLDHELSNELKEDQATYDQYNKVTNLNSAVLAYTGAEPVACGCYREIHEIGLRSNACLCKKLFAERACRSWF